MNPSLARRVQQLEQRFHVVEPPPLTAEDLLFHEKLEELLALMDEKHAAVVLEDLAHPIHEASELTLAVCRRAMDHIGQNTPLAFPGEVAEVYLSRTVSFETECEGCGYSVPDGSFRVCPLCGGRLVWPLYTPGE